jgi:hypothetical protein
MLLNGPKVKIHAEDFLNFGKSCGEAIHDRANRKYPEKDTGSQLEDKG